MTTCRNFFHKNEINWILSKMSFSSRIEINALFGKELVKKRRIVKYLVDLAGQKYLFLKNLSKGYYWLNHHFIITF